MIKIVKIVFLSLLWVISGVFLSFLIMQGVSIENDNMIKGNYGINYPKILYSEKILSSNRGKEEVRGRFGQKFKMYVDDKGINYYVTGNGGFLENKNVLVFNPMNANIRSYATFKDEYYFECSEKSDRCVINGKVY